MTDKVLDQEQIIEYAQLVQELDPLSAQVEVLRDRNIRVPIFFYDNMVLSPENLSEEEMASLEENFEGIQISREVKETFVSCTVSQSRYNLVFQTETYGFYSTFPIFGYVINPFYEIYEGNSSKGKVDLQNGVSEDIHKKIICLRDIALKKIEVKLSGN